MLHGLRVVHIPRSSDKHHTFVGSNFSEQKMCPLAFTNVFLLETCLRRVAIYYSFLNQQLEEYFTESKIGNSFEIFKGEDAYQFLLQLSCGLKSELMGETEIFGQIKNACQKFESSRLIFSSDYRLLFQKWFEDTKEIRSQYLQKIGSQSYGSLLRKIVTEKADGNELKVSVVGAGALAESIIPWLMDDKIFSKEISILNRTEENARKMISNLFHKNEKTSSVFKYHSRSEEPKVWSETDILILCVPYADEIDQDRYQWFLERQLTARPLIVFHLGAKRSESSGFNHHNYLFLDDLFKIQFSQNDFRIKQFEAVFSVCKERAKLRSLGGNLSIAHGWEDLALFA